MDAPAARKSELKERPFSSSDFIEWGTAAICAKRKFPPSVISRVPNPLAATDETVSPTAPISCVVQSTKYSCEVAFFCLPDLPSQKI